MTREELCIDFERFGIRRDSLRIIESCGEVFVVISKQKFSFLFKGKKIKNEIEMRKPIGIKVYFIVGIFR